MKLIKTLNASRTGRQRKSRLRIGSPVRRRRWPWSKPKPKVKRRHSKERLIL